MQNGNGNAESNNGEHLNWVLFLFVFCMHAVKAYILVLTGFLLAGIQLHICGEKTRNRIKIAERNLLSSFRGLFHISKTRNTFAA